MTAMLIWLLGIVVWLSGFVTGRTITSASSEGEQRGYGDTKGDQGH